MSPRRWAQSGSSGPSGRTTLSGKRGDVEHIGDLPKTTPQFLRRRRLQCWRAPPRLTMEVLPRGARTTSTPPRCSSMSSAHAMPYRAPVTRSTIRTPAIHHPYRHRKGVVRTGHNSLLEETRRRTGRVPPGVLAAFPAVESHRTGRKVLNGLRGHDMEEAHHRRGYVTVEAMGGEGQPRGEAVWGRRTRRSGARRTESTNATRDRQLARCH